MTTYRMASNGFAPHGQFDAYVEGHLLISEVIGPWNRELVDAWAQALHPVAKAICTRGPHVGIAIIRQSILCPPDALEALRKVVLYSVQRLDNVGHVIVADESVEGRKLLAQTFARVYEGVVPYQQFEDLPSAKAWGNGLIQTNLAKRHAEGE
jgi:hypothetical protein